MSSFCRRHGYSGEVALITVAEDAPDGLPHAVVQIAAEEGLESPSSQRAVICRILRVVSNQYHWSEYPNIARELIDLISRCSWSRCSISYSHSRRRGIPASRSARRGPDAPRAICPIAPMAAKPVLRAS